MLPLTVLIPAHNAAATIERSIASAMVSNPTSILLVDDRCSDNTVARATNVSDSRLSVVRTEGTVGVAAARNRALTMAEGDYAVWLDADDVLMPGRLARMFEALEAGADIVYGGVTLLKEDGEHPCPIPQFMFRPNAQWRLFERNWLQGIGFPGVRLSVARKLMYDDAQTCAEDFDFALRAVSHGYRIAFLTGTDHGYRAGAQSLSRNLAQSLSDTRRALCKHRADAIVVRMVDDGLEAPIALWSAVSMCVQQREYQAALGFLDRISALNLPDDGILEPEGPYPLSNAWRFNFQLGTIRLLMGDAVGAIQPLSAAVGIRAERDARNNLSVALAQVGADGDARALLSAICEVAPGYLDAVENLASDKPARITHLPLRRLPSHSSY